MGGGQPPSPCDAAQDVSACLRARAERGRNAWSAEAADMACQSWTLRQTYLPSSWWGPRLVGRRSNPSAMKYINSRGYWDLLLESWNL